MYERVPLVDINQSDEPAGVFGAMPLATLPAPVNFATDESIQEFVRDQLWPLLERTRLARRPLEEEWSAIRRMDMLRHDSGRRYNGRSQAYLPIHQRNITTQVSMLSRGIFPSDDYMDVVDRDDGDPETAKPTKAYLFYEFDQVARIRTVLKPFLRQYLNYGNAVMKYWYKKFVRRQGRMSRVPDVTSMLGMSTAPQWRPVTCYEGLAVSARNLFNVYVYPETAETIDDVLAVFEDMLVPLEYAQQMGKAKRWENVDKILNTASGTNMLANMVTQLNDAASMAHDIEQLRNKLGDMRPITEVWLHMPLPKAGYAAGETPGESVPARIVMSGPVPLSVTRNPHFHQLPPYLFGRMNVEPGLFYGSGVGRAGRHTQYLANDFANQTNDCGIYSLNPIVKVNPAFLVGPLPPIGPGRVWQMTDVQNGAVFDRPPVELIQHGLTMLQSYIGMNQDFSGSPPILQGTGAGKAAKTATGAQLLQKNASLPLQDLVEDLEQSVLVPLMFGAWMNGQQYRESSVLAQLAGEAIKVSPEQLAINAEFRWLASSQTINQQQRAQQALMLMQAMLPLVPHLMSTGYIVDFAPLIKRVYTDGMGFRGFEQFIKPAQAMMGMAPGMPPQPGMMPNIQAEQGDRVRSALEQVGAMQGDMAPGEGEEFMSVRNEADDIAALMGSGGGF